MAHTKKYTLLELENDRLRLELAARERRVETYENSDSPSSTGSLYNAERAAFRKKMEKEDMQGDGPEPDGEGKARRGPPSGHAGASHDNKTERTVTLRVRKCRGCGRGHISGLPPGVKMVYDFAVDDSENSSRVLFIVSVSHSTVGTGPFPFLDDFEDGIMDGWDVSRDSFWSATYLYDPVYPPNHPATNKAAVAALCYDAGGCVMEMSASIDLAAQDDATLQLYRYLDDSLDSGEFLAVEAYDGTAWTELDRWTPENSDDDGAWHLEEYSLSAYSGVSDFNVRFVAVSSTLSEEAGIDDVRIFVKP